MFSLEHLATIRAIELDRARGIDVTAIEARGSEYAEHLVAPVTEYDGRNLPFPDESFDIVFSSNVLEHVPDLGNMHREIRRVLRPGGYCVHVMPTHSWRFWQTVVSYPVAAIAFLDLLPQLFPRSVSATEWRRTFVAWDTAFRRCGRLCLPRRHGERGNTITETAYFHPLWWRRHFAQHRFHIDAEEPMAMFYTGHMLLGPKLSGKARAKLAPALGSAARLYRVSPAS